MTRRRRRIRAAVEAASEDGTSSELLVSLAPDIAVHLELTEEQGTRLDWWISATRGKLAES